MELQILCHRYRPFIPYKKWVDPMWLNLMLCNSPRLWSDSITGHQHLAQILMLSDVIWPWLNGHFQSFHTHCRQKKLIFFDPMWLQHNPCPSFPSPGPWSCPRSTNSTASTSPPCLQVHRIQHVNRIPWKGGYFDNFILFCNYIVSIAIESRLTSLLTRHFTWSLYTW